MAAYHNVRSDDMQAEEHHLCRVLIASYGLTRRHLRRPKSLRQNLNDKVYPFLPRIEILVQTRCL